MLILFTVGPVLLMLGLGFKIQHATKPVQYMANAREMPEVEDVQGYNHALGLNFMLFGVLLLAVLLPMNFPMPMALITIFSIPFWAIGFMLRCMQIQSKYEKN